MQADMPADRSPLVWTRARGKNAQVEPYVAARIVGRTADGDVRIALENGAAPQQISEADTVLRNPPGTRPDNCQLLHLNEACVLENVSMRYLEGQIYTWTSHVLTAVNPYEPLPLYSEKLAAELPLMNSRDLPPHAFSIAELAVRKVVRGSQAIVVSGESGAGKTTNMAHVMAYLTRRSRNSGQADSALGAGLGTLLLQSNPVLEAFGNAQTVRNHNSSRFGKFIKVTYDASGTRMTGMFLQTYLLEKVRVVAPGAAERTYHVFYAMLDGASAAEVKHWGIRSQKDHQLTSGAAGTDAGAGNGSAETYSELRAAMSVLTVRQEEQVDLLGIVAAILHLRDVRTPRRTICWVSTPCLPFKRVIRACSARPRRRRRYASSHSKMRWVAELLARPLSRRRLSFLAALASRCASCSASLHQEGRSPSR